MHYIYIDSCEFTLRPSFALFYIGSVTARYSSSVISQTLRHWAEGAITLGIGPHYSCQRIAVISRYCFFVRSWPKFWSAFGPTIPSLSGMFTTPLQAAMSPFCLREKHQRQLLTLATMPRGLQLNSVSINRLCFYSMQYAVNCIRFTVFGTVCDISCLYMKYLRNCWTDFTIFTGKTCLVPRLDKFEGQGQRSRSSGTKNGRYPWNRWTDLCQIPAEYVFGPSLGRIWRSRAILAACMRFHVWNNIFALVYVAFVFW